MANRSAGECMTVMQSSGATTPEEGLRAVRAADGCGWWADQYDTVVRDTNAMGAETRRRADAAQSCIAAIPSPFPVTPGVPTIQAESEARAACATSAFNGPVPAPAPAMSPYDDCVGSPNTPGPEECRRLTDAGIVGE